MTMLLEMYKQEDEEKEKGMFKYACKRQQNDFL